LPWTGRVATRLPRVANALLHNRFSAATIKWMGDVSQRRDVPRFAITSFRRGRLARELRDEARPTVVLWPDTFTDLFLPDRGRATVDVLRHAGERVAVPKKWACCGRPLYDSGMLKLASSAGRNVLDVLDRFLALDIPIVVPEPSCLATFRDELPRLLPNDPRAAKLASLSRSLAEHLEAISWRSSSSSRGATVSVLPHCHQRAVQGVASELRVLRDSGFDVKLLDLGCCGLAGSFGFEKAHDELSRRIARDRFVPGIVRSSLDGPVILDGFSCRLQAGELTNVATTSTAELLAQLLRT